MSSQCICLPYASETERCNSCQKEDEIFTLKERNLKLERVAEAAKDVLAVRGTSWESSNLPAYMERPFNTLAELLKALK